MRKERHVFLIFIQGSFSNNDGDGYENVSKNCVRATSTLIGSLSNNVFERRTLTGSGLFSFFDGSFAQIFSQIASITVKKLRNTNFISSRHIKRENNSLPVDVRRSKTSLLKLPNGAYSLSFNSSSDGEFF